MALTHTWTTKVAVPGLPALPADAPLLITGPYGVELEINVPAGAVSQEEDISVIAHARIASIVINADLAPMDVYTNAADGTGGQHFALAANKSVAWNNQMTFANPITADITKFFANNASLKAGVLRVAVVFAT
jgi:hypothetical protein